MKMEEILKWGLIAGAAWFVLDKLQAQPRPAVAGAPPPGGYLPPGNGGGGTQPPANGGNGGNGQAANGASGGNGQTPTYRERMLAASGGANNLNPDQWNYFHHELTGEYFNWEAITPRTEQLPLLSIDRWISLMQNGIKGLNPLYKALAHPSTQWEV